MKGVLLSICPSARLVDLTHELGPQDIRGAALALEAALPFFPAGTVHLVVVDPGVGSARRALALRARGHYLVGPDNGALSGFVDGATAVALAAPEYRLADVSRTFHGRDVFAPAAAYLAAGVPLERLGPPVADPVRLPIPGSRLEAGALIGEVLDVDRFGNLLTSIESTRLEALPGAGPVRVDVAGHAVAGLVDTFADGPADAAAAIVGSTGRIEVFVREGSAARRLGVGRGAPVRIRRGLEGA